MDVVDVIAGGGILFAVLFLGASGLIAAVFVLVVVVAVRNWRRVAARGHDPLTVRSDLASRLLESQALAPERSKADRLAELDRLRAAGAISEEERATGRAAILSS